MHEIRQVADNKTDVRGHEHSMETLQQRFYIYIAILLHRCYTLIERGDQMNA
jgi:hypothetical protein